MLVCGCPNDEVVADAPKSPPVAGLLPKIDVLVVGVPNNEEAVVVVVPKPVVAEKINMRSQSFAVSIISGRATIPADRHHHHRGRVNEKDQ